MPRPELSVTPPALQPSQTNEMEVFTPAGAAPGNVLENAPIRWGPIGLRPHIYYRFLDGSGIPASEGKHVDTTIQEISPGLLFSLGSHWTLNYTPTWSFYSNRQFRNTLDHGVGLTGGTTYEDWVFGLSQGYSSSSAPLVETGTQTEQESYSTAISASCLLNSKMSLDLAVNQNLTSAAQFESSREWSTLDWLNYQFWARLNAALGLGFGYIDVDTGPDMTYERFQGRVNWRATDKLSFQIHGGLEDRQFLGGGSDQLNPIVGTVIQYQPFETTKLSLNVDRVVAVSLLTASSSQNQITETTSVAGDLNQRLLEKFYLDLGGGYHTVKYVTSGGAATDRKDNFYAFNVRLSCALLKRGTAAVFYQISDNSSSEPGFTFTSRQLGFELGYQY